MPREAFKAGSDDILLVMNFSGARVRTCIMTWFGARGGWLLGLELRLERGLLLGLDLGFELGFKHRY